MKKIKTENIPNIKRFVRLMEVSKKDNSYELSFLVSSNRNFSIILNEKEVRIFKLINGHNSLNKIVKLSKTSLNDVSLLLKKFNEKNILTFSKQDKNYQFDRHDLFYDMCFNKENFTKNIIMNKRILIVGAGGIGNNVILLLSRMGFNDFILIDKDIIELSNLSRQFLFNKNDIGKLKIDVLKREILNFDKNSSVLLLNSNFDKNIFEKIKKINDEKKLTLQ